MELEREYTIGQRIKNRRLHLKMTQESLADMMCVDKTTISLYENDKIDIKSSVIIELARILRTTPDYILGFGEDLLTLRAMNHFKEIGNPVIKEALIIQLKALSERGY